MSFLGRKIYYLVATGVVVQDTGERPENAVETTKVADFVTYPTLTGLTPSTVDFINLVPGALASDISAYAYHVDPVAKVIVEDLTTAQISSIDLIVFKI